MNIEHISFADLSLGDAFFDSLKADYTEFENWFNKKLVQGDKAFIIKNEQQQLEAFLYLKEETGEVDDVNPKLPNQTRVKVGTFKINPHGTKLGERFIKRILDYSLSRNIDEIYVTIFPKHTGLYNIFSRYGFEKHAEKTTANGTEDVLVKNISKIHNDTLLDYPKIIAKDNNKYVLAIKPEYHTKLFPDSILKTENFDVLQDISHTNSIHKVYIAFMDLGAIVKDDIIVIYRTTDGQGPALFRSVATSICVVTDIKTRASFASVSEYLAYCEPHSVFNNEELTEWYNRRGNLYVIKMTYNAAFTKRLTRKVLIEDIGLNKDAYWGFFKLSDDEFKKIAEHGKVNENIIVY